jgi:catecholate siderophore receptor
MTGKKMMEKKVLRKKQLVLAISLIWGITPLGSMAEEVEMQQSNPLATEAVSSSDEQAEGSGVLGNTTTLPTITVEAKGFLATETRIGKVWQDPHDIPQAVTSVTNVIMEEQQVGTLREALRNVSGLTFNAAEGGRSGDNMMLRSFYTFGDIYLDGVRDTAQYNRETFNLEQVDVLRGSAAMLFGRGQAGGVINQVTKSPLLVDRNKITGSLGSYDYYETTGDFNKVLGDTTALRVNAMKRTEGSWRSNPVTGVEPELDRSGLAASLSHGIGTHNEFNLSHAYTKTDDIPDYGISFDNNTRKPTAAFPSSYFWGIGRNFDESDTNITTASYNHHFSPTSEWRTQLRRAEYERSYWARTPSATIAPGDTGVHPGTPPRGPSTGPTRAMDYKTLALQSIFSNQFEAMGMKHEFLTGFEYLNEDSFRSRLQNLGGTDAANPPIFRPYWGDTTVDARNPVSFDSDSYAVYVQDTVEFIPRWKATVGTRRDMMDAQYSSATSPSLKYSQWSNRAALSFHPVAETHYYLSFSDSFSPTADLYQLTVTPLPPERSNVLELGTKWMLFEGDLAFRAALYQAEKVWERNTDLESTAAILTKKRRTNGLELEVAGRMNDNWEIFSGIALMNAKIVDVAENVNATTGEIVAGHPAYKGQRARNTPRYTFNLWTTYKLDSQWKVGSGIEAKGDRYGYNPSSADPARVPTLPGSTAFHPNTAPGYIRLDGMVSYEVKKYTVRLNLQNLLNKVYYDAIYDNGGFSVPGTKRKIILTGEFKF